MEKGQTDMDITWILVAHNAGARIFRRNRPRDGLEIVLEIDHPEGRLRNHEINSDKPGRRYRGGDQNRHGTSNHEMPDEHLAIEFARKLASILDDGRSQNLYRNVVLVAGPKMLGMLRENVDKKTKEKIVATLDKDLGRVDDGDLPQHLRPALEKVDYELVFGRSA